MHSDGGVQLSALIDGAIEAGIRNAFVVLAERYAAGVLGAECSARVGTRGGYRSGSRTIRMASPVGPLDITLVKSRNGLLRPPALRDAKRFGHGVKELVVKLWTYGLSHRSIAEVAPGALRAEMGHTSVGTWVKDAEHAVLAWLARPIPTEIRYLTIDGAGVSKKRQSVRNEPVLVFLGITDDGTRHVLDLMPANGESIEASTTLIHRLLGCRQEVSKLRMAITDGNAGIIAALAAELPGVPRQRCTVHKTCNVLHAAVPTVKSAAAKQATAIWNGLNKSEARQRALQFEQTWRDDHPRLADIIKDDFEATLTFYDMDANTWKSLRSTNVIERFNREMRRRFDDMGTCRGDDPVTRTAGLVAMRLAKQWEGKVARGFKTAKRRNPFS